ncbi:MAG: transposase [Methylobacter sp.]|uniref:REP-associated tyrosine transposase n=1 Tax=Methylobacter sp. TaxID=2051955 RepID=UPI0025E6006F|nr:transposase [Methylobacter sp.]MCK9622840.1 transposase [Methylobacter sp.]
MGRSRYRICDEKAPHFLTCTVLNWIPLFTRPQTAGIILDALRYRQEEHDWKIYGYVILENHLHMIVQAENLAVELPRFKSFTARNLIDHLKECRAERLLQQLAFFRKEYKREDRDYQCWEEGSHPQLIENEQVLRQKLEYIHQNPVKRGYVDEAEHWRYSSARDYAGVAGLIPVFKDWL